MEYILYGALGVVLTLALLGCGAYIGYTFAERKHETERPRAETPGELERQRLIEDHNAFQMQMGYSAEVAYGQVSPVDLAGSKGGSFD